MVRKRLKENPEKKRIALKQAGLSILYYIVYVALAFGS